MRKYTLSVYTCNVIYVSCFKSKSVTKILFYASFDVLYKTYMTLPKKAKSTYLILDNNCTRLHNDCKRKIVTFIDVTLLQIKMTVNKSFPKRSVVRKFEEMHQRITMKFLPFIQIFYANKVIPQNKEQT